MDGGRVVYTVYIEILLRSIDHFRGLYLSHAYQIP